MMDLKCLIVPGMIVAMVMLMALNAIGLSVSQKQENARRAWLNNSMKGSKLYQPAPTFVPGEPIVCEVQAPAETELDRLVREMKEREARLRARSAEMRQERAEQRSTNERARRSEMDALILRAKESLNRGEEDWKWKN